MANILLPISSKASLSTAINSLNMVIRSLSAETTTKTVKQNGGSAITSGKLSNGRYGEVISDSTNIPRIIIGQKPSNGEPIIAISKTGIDVLEALKNS